MNSNRKLGIVWSVFSCLALGALTAHAQVYTNFTTGNWSNTTVWGNGSRPAQGGGYNYTLVFTNNGAVLSTNNWADGTKNFTLNQLIFSNATGALTIQGGAGTNLVFTNNAGVLPTVGQYTSTNLTFNHLINLATNTTFNGSGSGVITLNSNVFGVGQMIVNLTNFNGGSGNLLLSASNTFSGGLVISNGSVWLNNAYGLGSGAALVANGGSLYLKAGGTTTNNITINGTGNGNGAIRNSSGNNTLSGVITLGSDAFIAAAATANSLTNSGTINLGGYTLTLSPIIQVITGAITNSGNLVITTGLVIMSGANTYSGSTTITGGMLEVTKTNALPNFMTAGKVAVTNATLAVGVGGAGQWQGGDISNLLGAAALANTAVLGLDTAGGNFTNNFAITNAIGLIKLGANTLLLTNNNTYSGTTVISNGTLQVGDGGALGTGTVSALSGSTLLFSRGDSYSVSNNISGAGVLQTANGTMTLVGTNTITGNTTVSNGTLIISGGMSNAAALFVGVTTGTGTVNQTAGLVQVANLYVGNGGYTGIYNLYGGTLSNTAASQATVLGVNNGSTAILNITNGVFKTAELDLGRNYTGGSTVYNTTNYFNQSGGTATVNTLYLGGSYAQDSNQVAYLNITNGTFTATTFGALAAAANDQAQIYLGTGAVVTLPAFPTTLGASATATITFDGGTLIPAASATNYLGNVTTASLTTNGANFNVGSGISITVSQNLQNASSQNGVFTKSGIGTLVLAGTNMYSGGTLVNAGTLEAAGTNALPYFTTPGKVAVTNATLAVNVGGVGQWQGGDISNLLGAAALANTAVLGLDTAGGNFTNNFAITNAINLTKLGANTLLLTNNNTYNGTTVISAGTLQVGDGGTLGTGTITNTSGGTLYFSRGDTYTVANNITGTGTNLTSNGTVTFSGTNSAGVLYLGGTVNITSNFNTSGKTIIGNSVVGGGTLNWTGTGTFNTANFVGVGDGTNGTLNVLGGSLSFTPSANGAFLGNSGGVGTMLVSNATFNLANANLFMIGGVSNYTTTATTGTLTIANGGVVIVAGSSNSVISLGNAQNNSVAGVVGTINLLSGGQFQTGRSFTNGYGSGYFYFNGGTLRALTNNPTYMQGLTAAYVSTNGSFLDSSNFTITIAQSLLTDPALGGAVDGGLTKLGSNTLTLAGVNTYIGPTTVSAGTLNVTNNQSAATGSWLISTNLAANVTVNFQANSIIVVTAGNQIQIGGTPGSGYATNNVSGVVTNNGTLGVTRQASLNLNNGSTWLQNSNMSLNGNGGGSVYMTVNNGGTFTYAGGQAVQLNPASANFGKAILTIGGTFITSQGFTNTIASSTGAANLILTGGGTLRLSQNIANLMGTAGSTNVFQLNTSGGVIDTGVYTAGLSQAISSTGGLTKAGTGMLTLTGTNTYSGATTISGGALVIGRAGLLGSGAYAGPITNNASLVWNSSASQTLSGAMSGTGFLQQSGPGTLVLSGSNTYGGGTIINAGLLQFATNYAVSTTGNILINTGGAAVLDFTGIQNSGVLTNFDTTSTGVIALTTNSAVESLDFNTPNLSNVFLGAVGNVTYTGVLTNYVSTVKLTGIGGTLTFNQSITGGVGVVIGQVGGTGMVVLASGNTYTGGTVINSGTLNIGDDTALGAPPLTAVTNLTFNGNSTLQFANSFALDTNRTLLINSGVTAVFDTQSNTNAIPGSIVGAGGLNKTGAGMLVLSGQNSYTGNTTNSLGILAVGADYALGGGTLVIGRGTLQAADANAHTLTNNLAFLTNTVFGAAGTGNLLFNGAYGDLSATTRTLTISNTVTTINNVLTNIAGLTKAGPGTLTLGGANTYSGLTTVNAGTLVLAGSLTNSSITVASGATFSQSVGSVIAGSGVSLTSSGMTTLSGVNTYGGSTIIKQNTVQLGSSTALPSNSVVFFGDGTSTFGTLDMGGYNSATIAGLVVAAPGTGATPYTNTIINLAPGQTLNVVSSANSNIVNIGTTRHLAMSGGGTFNVNDPNGGLLVMGFGIALNTAPNAYEGMDLSQLGNFSASVSNIIVGYDINSPQASRWGILSLATNNTITANSMTLGYSTQDGSVKGLLFLGQSNTLNVGTLTLGYQKGFSLLTFADGFVNPVLNIAGKAGGTDRANVYIGQLNTGTGVYATNSLMITNAGASINAQLNQLVIATLDAMPSGANGPTGYFTFNDGVVNVNTVTVGRSLSAATKGVAYGFMTQNGGTLNVNSNFVIALQNGVGSVVNGTVNLAGGTANIFTDILGGNGVSTLNLTGGLLDMNNNRLGSSGSGFISNLTLQAGTLRNVAEINGGAPLVKTSTNTLILDTANSYSGGTIISNGTLLVNNASGMATGTNTVNIYQGANGGTLAGTGAVASVIVNGFGHVAPGNGGIGTLTMSNLTMQGYSLYDFEINLANTQTNDQIFVLGNLTINGGKFNFYQDGTTIPWTTNGVYDLIQFSGSLLGSSPSILLGNAPKTYIFGTNGNWLTVEIADASYQWNGSNAVGSSYWSSNDNWIIAPPSNGGVPLTFDGSQLLNNTNDFAPHTRFAGLIFSNTAGAFVLNGNDINLIGNVDNFSTNLQTLNMPLVMDGVNVSLNATSNSLVINGAISETNGSWALLLNGPNALTLTASNSYSGGTVINAGTLIASNANALGSGMVTLTNGLLQLQQPLSVGSNFSGNAGSYVDLGTYTLTINQAGSNTFAGAITNNGALVVGGSGTLVLSGTNTSYTGGTTINGVSLLLYGANLGSGLTLINSGKLQLGDGVAFNASVGGDISNNASLVFANPLAQTYGGAISGSGTLTKQGAGTLTLAGVSTYRGATILNQGTLQLAGGNNTLPTNTTVSFTGSSTLDLQGYNQTISNMTFGAATMTNIITGATGSLTVNGNSDLSFGPSTGTSAVTVDLSGLGTFTYNVASKTFRVGPASTATYPAIGIVELAATNTITASAFALGDQALGSSSTATNILHLGQVNTINANTITIGSREANALLDFQSGLSSPSLVLRGTAGGSSYVGSMVVGTQSDFNPNTKNHIFDVSAGYLDALIGTLTVGQVWRTGKETGTVLMGSGTLMATNIILGQHLGTNTSNIATGIFSLNGGTVNVQTLTLSDNPSNGIGNAYGTFVLGSNGLLQAQTITKGSSLGGGSGLVTWVSGTLANQPGNNLSITGITVNISGTGLHNLSVDGGQTAIEQVNTVMLGSGTLTKIGDGTLTLNGANTYSGGTVINGGTLVVSNAGALGSGTVTLSNGLLQLAQALTISSNFSGNIGATVDLGAYILTINQGGNSIYAGTITNSGALVKSGAGTLTLAGANTYSGGTTISGGTLAIGNDAALGAQGDGALVGFLTLTNGGTLYVTNSVTLNNRAVKVQTGGGYFNVDTGSALTISNNITGAGALTASGMGALLLTGSNNLSGAVNIYGGAVTLTGPNVWSGNGTVGSNAVLNITSNLTFSQMLYVGTGAGTTSIVNQTAGTVALNNASYGVLLGAFSGTGIYNLYGGTLSGPSSDEMIIGVHVFGTGIFNMTNGVFNAPGRLELGRITSGYNTNTTSYFNQSGGIATVGSLIIAPLATETAYLNISNGVFTATAFSNLASVATATGHVYIGSGAQVTLPAFPRPVGYADLTFDGGTLTPSVATNNYMTNLAHVWITANGATLNVTNNITIAQSLENAGAQAGSLTKTGGATLTLSGANSYSGGTTNNGGTLKLASAGALPSYALTINAGALDQNGYAISVTTLNGLSGGSITNYGLTVNNGGSYAGKIVGSGALTNNAGTLTLSGTNSYQGGTVVNSGSLLLANGNALPSGSALSVVGSGAAVDLGGFATTVSALNGAGLVTNATSLVVTNGSFSGAIVGTGSLTKSGAGTLNLSGPNSYSAGTTVNGGTLQLGNNGALLAGSTLYVDIGGTFDIAGFSQVVGSIHGSRGAIVDSSLGAGGTLTLNFGSPQTFYGTLSGPGNLTLTGGGTLIMNGTNGFRGLTSVSNSTYTVNGQHSGGVIMAYSNSLVNGAGSISALNVNGGTYQPGSGLAATQYVGSLTLTNNGVVDIALGSSMVMVTNSLTIAGGQLHLNFNSYTFVRDQVLTLVDYTGTGYNWSDTNSWLTLNNGGSTLLTNYMSFAVETSPGSTNFFHINYDGLANGSSMPNAITLTAVPEPGTASLLGLVGVTLLVRRRLRRRTHGRYGKHD